MTDKPDWVLDCADLRCPICGIAIERDGATLHNGKWGLVDPDTGITYDEWAPETVWFDLAKARRVRLAPASVRFHECGHVLTGHIRVVNAPTPPEPGPVPVQDEPEGETS